MGVKALVDAQETGDVDAFDAKALLFNVGGSS
jgi:hypothetical protein